MLVLLTGPIGAGKTTLCRQAAAAARAREVAVGGVLAPPLIDRGVKVGIAAVDVASQETRVLARVGQDLGGPQVGRYSFSADALDWTVSRCRRALSEAAIVFVDEIGPLELERGGGLAPLLPLLAQPRPAPTVAVVRDGLVEELQSRLAPAVAQVVRVTVSSRDGALASLEACLLANGEEGGGRDS
jgi:nucleoside-triphosphatase THEP1